MPPWLWRQAILVTGNLGCLAIGTVMMGVTVFLPAYVQGVMGRSPAVAGFAPVRRRPGRRRLLAAPAF